MYDIQIELKTKCGKRTTVSIDALIFRLYSKQCGGEKAARANVRKNFNGDSVISSRAVRSFILHSIVRPELLIDQKDTE